MQPVVDRLDHFLSRLERVRDEAKQSHLKEAIVLHHDEADGLTSGALAKLALERLGFTTRLICLDKLYPEVLRDVETGDGTRRVIVFSDLGSAHVGWLTEYNRSKNLLIILDHHDTAESNDPHVHNLNPILDGFSGERDASAASVAYLFAKFVDPHLSKHAHLGMVGAAETPGDPEGLNRIVVRDALEQGLAKVSKSDFKIEVEGFQYSRGRLATVLNVLGSVGYYRDGPRIGIESCLRGFNQTTLDLARKLEEERKMANQRILQSIKTGSLHKEKMIQWFNAEDNYAGMSGKVVGSFCSYLRFQGIVDQSKYLVGMMNVPVDIPGWGKLPGPLVKVSGRAPRALAGMIERGEKPPLSRMISQACRTAGGFGDGHSVAASGVFPVGREKVFLAEMDLMASILEKKVGGSGGGGLGDFLFPVT